MAGHRLLVLADAHIGAAPPESEAALLAFLQSAPGLGDSLLIAGDLFEFWFAYRQVIPRRAFAVAAALRETAGRMPVAMVGGNHDRWGDPFWVDEAGIRYGREQLRVDAGGRTVLALHGDGLMHGREGVRWTHRLVGHPVTSALFRLLHPDLGLRLVDRMGPLLASEEKKSAEEKRQFAARQRAWAERRLVDDPALGALIMGHTHLAASSEAAPGRYYLNPGAWFQGGAYAVLSDNGVEHRRFIPTPPPPHPTAAPR